MAACGVFLGRVLQAVLGHLDQAGDELGPGRGRGDAGGSVLDQEAAQALDEQVVIEKRVVVPGQDVLELEELEVDEVEQHLVLDLAVRGELRLVDLGHELLVEPVEGLVELVEGAFARVLELVVVFREALEGPGRRVELEIGVPEAVLELLELGVLGRLGQKGARRAGEEGQRGDDDGCLFHSFLLKNISQILAYIDLPYKPFYDPRCM